MILIYEILDFASDVSIVCSFSTQRPILFGSKAIMSSNCIKRSLNLLLSLVFNPGLILTIPALSSEKSASFSTVYGFERRDLDSGVFCSSTIQSPEGNPQIYVWSRCNTDTLCFPIFLIGLLFCLTKFALRFVRMFFSQLT